MSLRDQNTPERIDALHEYLAAEGLSDLEIASLCAVSAGAIIADLHNKGVLTPAQRDEAITGGQMALYRVAQSTARKLN